MSINKNAKSNIYNNSYDKFIPIVCHYDKHTLITKNGELIQTIQIDGINAENISTNLASLRRLVRKAIHSASKDNKFAFWIHTTRTEENLNDSSEYHNQISSVIHDNWQEHNNWQKKFVNQLYITVVHHGSDLKIKNFSGWVNSISFNKILQFEDERLKIASTTLHDMTKSMIDILNEYGAQRLGITEDNNIYYSDLMFLYSFITQLTTSNTELPTLDMSSALESHKYAIGADKIEIVCNESTQFASLVAIKEYQEIPTNALDKLLHIPVEMIITEVFIFDKAESVISKFTDQTYIANVSKCSELKKSKKLDLIESASQNASQFGHQQLSIMVIDNDIKTLEDKLSLVSTQLFNLGILHVREDINLEKIFWSQLPGNFSFLSRMRPTLSNNIAAFSALHNIPIGQQHNPWGRAVTLVPTTRNTPYFMNFHDNSKKGTTCIFGEPESGKTTLLNFLISESNKYSPETLYITNDSSSDLYIKANAGKIINQKHHILNPLLCEDTTQNRACILEFLTIISKHYFDPLTEAELHLLTILCDRVFTASAEERKLSNLIESLQDSDKGGKSLKSRLSIYSKDAEYYGVFESEENHLLQPGEILSINLDHFDQELYTKEHYPKDKKLVEEFNYNVNTLKAIKVGVIIAAQNIFSSNHSSNTSSAKIFAINNLSEIVDLKQYSHIFDSLSNNMHNINGVFISTANLQDIQKLYQQNAPSWISTINTMIVMSYEINLKTIENLLDLNSHALEKLLVLSKLHNSFLITQNNESIGIKFNLSSFNNLKKILSSDSDALKQYIKIIDDIGISDADRCLSAIPSVES